MREWMPALFGSKKHPKGPDWASAREHHLDLAGTLFYFTVPAHTNSITPFQPKPETYNLYAASRYWKHADSIEPASSLENVFSIRWQFGSFWLKIGTLEFDISINHNIAFGSLYKPEHFLSALNQRLNYSVGPLSWEKKGQHQVRKNWSVQHLGQTTFAYYEKSGRLYTSRFWETPVSDEYHLILAFRKETYLDDADIRINLDHAYDELIDNIIASIRIEWSTYPSALQAAAKLRWPGETLPATLPELVWSDEEWLAAESEKAAAEIEADREYRELLKEFAAIQARNGDMPA